MLVLLSLSNVSVKVSPCYLTARQPMVWNGFLLHVLVCIEIVKLSLQKYQIEIKVEVRSLLKLCLFRSYDENAETSVIYNILSSVEKIKWYLYFASFVDFCVLHKTPFTVHTTHFTHLLTHNSLNTTQFTQLLSHNSLHTNNSRLLTHK